MFFERIIIREIDYFVKFEHAQGALRFTALITEGKNVPTAQSATKHSGSGSGGGVTTGEPYLLYGIVLHPP